MSLTGFDDDGGYNVIDLIDDSEEHGPTVTTTAPRFGRRAAPNALDQEQLSKDGNRYPSTATMPSITASQDRPSSTAGRRGPRRSLNVIGTDAVKHPDEFAHSGNVSSSDMKLPQIRSSQSRDGLTNGTVNGRRRIDGSAGPRQSSTSPSVGGQARTGLFGGSDKNGAANGRPYPARPHSTVEGAAADEEEMGTETFLDDRVSVDRGSFTGTRSGWVREQARRLEEQVAAAQALANSPHSLSSIRQRSANNNSWRQRMEGSMSITSPEKHFEDSKPQPQQQQRREVSAPAATTAAAAPKASTPIESRRAPPRSSLSNGSAATTASAPTNGAAAKRHLAPIQPVIPATSHITRVTPLNNRRLDSSSPDQGESLARVAIADSVLSAEYGHVMGSTGWNQEFSPSDVSELFPTAQTLNGAFMIGGKRGSSTAASSNNNANNKAKKNSTTSAPRVPLRQATRSGSSPAKNVIPSAPASDSVHEDHTPQGVTPSNASNTSRLAAGNSQRSTMSTDKIGGSHAATISTSPAVSPSKGGAAAAAATKATDGSLYTAEQRAKLDAWQSIPILSYRPADAERYAADCDKYFPAPKRATTNAAASKNLFVFPAPGRAPPEMAGEAVEVNYEIHNVLTLLRHRERKPMWSYPAMIPPDMPVQTRQRRPRTPRSFYGPEMPAKGNDWFRNALNDAVRVPSPDLTEIEAREAEEKKLNPKALKGVGSDVAAAHRERQEQEQENLDDINRAAIPIEA